ncbi:hypothetical protein ENSA5_59990 [Enhygromyxa salina]|uniref:Uncharacterized protein n=1 Tax=Enhygromyxa salina TaxID=215803 RepID=A0A2S9XDI2_9BACT|nr:hypothetical protein [Enhygromyxa salina]PRP90924.1 hypothetical protein ENSA5_59990 [Enhygromyxa salina]
MSAGVPPSQRRLRSARAAGLRPRSRGLVLAGLALIVWAVFGPLAGLGAGAPAWLGAALDGAFAGRVPVPPDPAPLAAALAALLGGGGIAVVVLGGRRRSRRELGVDPEIGEIPPGLGLAWCVGALVLVAGGLLPALAGAARSVDAELGGGASLWVVWAGWSGRGLLTLALVAALVGVIERLVSARRLWQGLHLTRAQARERARASGDRRP